LLQFKLHDATSFVMAVHIYTLGFQCRLDRHRLHRADKFARDGSLDTGTTKYQASLQAKHQIRTVATIRRPWRLARINHRKATTTTPAGQQACQQRSPATPGFYTARAAESIGREQSLVPLELRPFDIALMVILQQNLTLLKRLSVPIALADVAVDEFSAFFAFAVGVSPRIERILQHRDDISIADGTPLEGNHTLAIRWPRKVNSLTTHY
jgi:hypothetical protein